jgi:formate-dependent nitrite reductase membrane component NrfD
MSDKYSTGVRFNHGIGTLEILSFVGEGVGAMLFILSVVLGGQLAISVLGIGFVVFAVLVLRAHLGQPTRGWRALTRLLTSWVSRGTLVISFFCGFATLSVVARYIGVLQPLQGVLTVLALVFAVAVVVYAGMLLRSMRAIRLWRGPFMPLTFVSHSVASGLTIVGAMVAWLGAGQASYEWLQPAGLGSLVLCALLSVVHLYGVERSVGTEASRVRLLHGDLRARFSWGAGVLGILVPLVVWLAAYVLSAITGPEVATAVFVVAALCRLYGDYAYRSCIVRAGAYEPLLPSGFTSAPRSQGSLSPRHGTKVLEAR